MAFAGRGGRGGSTHFKKGGGGRGRGRGFSRGGGDRGNSRGRGAAVSEIPAPLPKSHATKEIDLNVASKVSYELSQSINFFKNKLQSFSLGESLEELLRFLPPSFVQMHIPSQILAFRSYLNRFAKGSSGSVVAYLKWMEWAEYERNKAEEKQRQGGHKRALGVMPEDDIEAVKERSARHEPGETCAELRSVAQERQHMRALLQMCLRHNSEKRNEGQRALLNHLSAQIAEIPGNVHSAAELKEVAHHSVPYALSRLVLGMAVNDASTIFLNTQMLYLILKGTTLPCEVLISLLSDELALPTRMQVMETRVRSRTARGAVALDDDEMFEEGINPDDINDPSATERRQKLAAALFAIVAILASGKTLRPADIVQLMKFLSFLYIEQRGTRVLSGNLIMYLIKTYGMKVIDERETWKWVSFALFRFTHVEYYRPEAVQMLIALMVSEEKPAIIEEPVLVAMMQEDPLEAQQLEKIANALFRKDQVTAVHPMIHPVWDDIVNLIAARCAAGESLQAHLRNFVNVIIAPYRRGVADVPRRELLQRLAAKIGAIALQNEDEAERMEGVRVASSSMGTRGISVAKPSDPAALRSLSASELAHKVGSLTRQLPLIKDDVLSAQTQRKWVLRELRAVLMTPVPPGADTPYVDVALGALLDYAFRAQDDIHDDLNQNMAVYLFAEAFSYSYGGKGLRRRRPLSTLDALDVMAAYDKMESSGASRFSTALNDNLFGKARSMIREALQPGKSYSVLFFGSREIRSLLALLYILLSVDDPANAQAQEIARSSVPDLVRFYKEGTIENIQLLLDVLMQLILRSSSPMHVISLSSSIRKLATAYLFRFSAHIHTKEALDIVLAPLVDAYHTNDREIIRNMRSAADGPQEDEAAESGDESETDSEASAFAGEDAEADDESIAEEKDVGAEETETETETEGDTEPDTDGSDSDEGSETGIEKDEEEAEDAESEQDFETGEEQTEAEEVESDADEESWASDEEDEEGPDAVYLASLKRIVGDVDLGFVYPAENANTGKNDVVRAITTVARVSLGLRSPVIVHAMQVLLAVVRENVKIADPVVFDAARAAVEMLLVGRQRYFGSFLPAEDLLQILGDIQSYCRKQERALLAARRGQMAGITPQVVFKRMKQLKALALATLHYIGFLAYKNGASEDVNLAITEYYISIFCDKGWYAAGALAGIKRSMFHYRHAFAWVFVPAAIEKACRLRDLAGVLRTNVFIGCCTLITLFVSRMGGLPQSLKMSCGRAVQRFVELYTPKEVYDMKHTAIYDLCHLYKMIIEYNSRLQVSTDPIRLRVEQIVGDDEIQVSKASLRKLDALERLLGLTQRALNTKHSVPLSVLHKQHEPKWKKEKIRHTRKAKAVRNKTLKALLAHRNEERTDEERARKRQRREELKKKDNIERQLLREERLRSLTPEEKAERRKQMLIAKQERIAKNKRRQLKIHELRKKSFEKWREQKLAEGTD